MNYPLYNLNYKEFEDLIATICNKILGTGTITFSDGTDGGRDACFDGTSNNFPSESRPWKGKFVIQAKHTTKPIASCSDSDFATIIKNEIPKILKLKKAGKLDNYILFTNRKLTGGKYGSIQDIIDNKININHHLIGVETIQLWLNEYREIVKAMDLNKLLLPLEFYEDDIRDIINIFSENRVSDEEITNSVENYHKLPIEEKNRLNDLSKEYFENSIKRSYQEFQKIETFLKDPGNVDLVFKYQNTVSDINAQILVHRGNYGVFEEIFEHIYRKIENHADSKLMNNRRFIRIFLHYMYANCDIGRNE